MFPAFSTFQMHIAREGLHLLNKDSDQTASTNKGLTLTDIFHQFDTITLRGRTSIDRHLDLQQHKQVPSLSATENQQPRSFHDKDLKRQSLSSATCTSTDLPL